MENNINKLIRAANIIKNESQAKDMRIKYLENTLNDLNSKGVFISSDHYEMNNEELGIYVKQKIKKESNHEVWIMSKDNNTKQ